MIHKGSEEKTIQNQRDETNGQKRRGRSPEMWENLLVQMELVDRPPMGSAGRMTHSVDNGLALPPVRSAGQIKGNSKGTHFIFRLRSRALAFAVVKPGNSRNSKQPRVMPRSPYLPSPPCYVVIKLAASELYYLNDISCFCSVSAVAFFFAS